MQLVLCLEESEEGERHGGNLTDDRRDCRAGNPHLRAAEEPEDHDRVQNDIDNAAQSLHQHRPDHVAGGLQHLFNRDLHLLAHTSDQDDEEILSAQLPDGGRVGEKGNKRPRGE